MHRLFPQLTAKVMLPLHVKSALSLRLPIQYWLGGVLLELYKGKGLRTVMSSYRDISLADLNGKDFGSFLRCGLMVAVAALAGSCQHGSGLNGASTDICHIAVPQCIVLAKIRKCSAATLFVDIVSAFASIARRIAMPNMPESEEGWKLHILSIGFSPAEADEIVRGAISALEWKDAGASGHALELLTATHASSWFSIDGIITICKHTRGTPAGTSLADIVYILCMGRVVDRI